MRSNMSKGGYLIVSLKNRNILPNESNIPQSFVTQVREVLDGNYYKPILLSDIVLDGVDMPDTFDFVGKYGNNYVFYCNYNYIVIGTIDIYSLPYIINLGECKFDGITTKTIIGLTNTLTNLYDISLPIRFTVTQEDVGVGYQGEFSAVCEQRDFTFYIRKYDELFQIDIENDVLTISPV